MSDVAVRVEGVGKRYRIGAAQASYRTLREAIVDAALAPFRRLGAAADRDAPHSKGNTIWALKDVTFEVKQGEVLGVIGRNGAGKSTLLRILSRITKPTEGKVRLVGRVGSLLEVGTGFHAELTGRENVYLNGAILGMRRAEIDKRFDEIVSFAETEQFLDTPVKHYSSGMHLRLAFSVAAHLQPEILLVDEVLAVGDAAFQKKCIGKMEDVARLGRTVLFVSHNLAAVMQLCPRSMLLDRGHVSAIEDSETVIRRYLASALASRASVELSSDAGRQGSRSVLLEWAEIRDADNSARQRFSIGEDVTVAFGLRVMDEGRLSQRVKLAIQLRSSDGMPIANIVDADSGFEVTDLHANEVISARLRDVRLYPDSYFVSLWVGSEDSNEVFDYAENCLSFEIVGGGRLTSRRLPRSSGILFLTPDWSREAANARSR